MKNKIRVNAQVQKHMMKERAIWMKNHPIIKNEDGNFSAININNSFQDYDARKEELEMFNFTHRREEERNDEFGEDYLQNSYEDYVEDVDEENFVENLLQHNIVEINENNNERSFILQQIDNLQMELRTFQVPDDDSEPFSVQSLATKGEFTRAYSEMCSTLRLNNLTQSKILEFMHKFNPSQSLPIKKSPLGYC
jgi:hypothetical protein